MVDETPRRYRALSDIPRDKETNMQNETFKAVVNNYNHNRSLGFLNLTLKKGTKLAVDINGYLSDKDPNRDELFEVGEVLNRDVELLVFLHARVLEDAGYHMGPSTGDELEVKFTRREKGLTVTWVKGEKNNAPARSENEPRPLNKHLPMVKGRVTNVNTGRNFAFLRTNQECNKGEVSEKPIDVYVHLEMARKAGYDDLQEGDELEFKFWTFQSGKSSAVLIKRKPEERKEETAQNQPDETTTQAA